MSEKVLQMKCKTCGNPITKDNAIPEGYCDDCVKATNELLEKLDKMIPYDN